jgi:hypothetical protein
LVARPLAWPQLNERTAEREKVDRRTFFPRSPPELIYQYSFAQQQFFPPNPQIVAGSPAPFQFLYLHSCTVQQLLHLNFSQRFVACKIPSPVPHFDPTMTTFQQSSVDVNLVRESNTRESMLTKTSNRVETLLQTWIRTVVLLKAADATTVSTTPFTPSFLPRP